MNTLTLRTPEDIISAVPHLIGFHPAESLVVMVPGGSPPIGRIDMPTTDEHRADVVDAFRSLYRDNGNRPMLAVTYTDDDDAADKVVALLGQRGTVLTHIRVHADTYRADDGPERPLADSLKVEAEMVFKGSNPAPSREALALPTRITRSLARELSTGKFDGRQGDEEQWVLGRLTGNHDRLDDADLARLLTGCRRFGQRFRDVIHTTLDRTKAQRDQWRDAAERVGFGWTEVHVTYAFASWLAGDGSHAWIGLDAVHDSPNDRDQPLADLIAVALANGFDPASFTVATLAELGDSTKQVSS